MASKRFTMAQIIHNLLEVKVGLAEGRTTGEVCKRVSTTEQTDYRWRREYGRLKMSPARRLKVLERQNTRLKKVAADARGWDSDPEVYARVRDRLIRDLKPE